MIVAVIAVVVIGVLATSGYFRGPAAEEGLSTAVRTAVRGDLLVTVMEDGNLESASNVDVKCQVAGGTSILWIVEDGAVVEKGQKIIELDASALEEQINQQRNTFEKARAAKIQAEQDYRVAEISVQEYLDGTFKKELQDAEKEITIALENLRSAQSALAHAQMMFRKGYVSKNQLEAEEFAVQRAQLEVDSANTAKEVLENFTKVKTVEDLRSKVDIAQAKKNSEQAAFDLEQQRLERLEAQLENCVITAPESGMIVYANERANMFGGGQGVVIEEGAAVRERQTIVRIPDLRQMQVRTNVHESKVDLLDLELAAEIKILGQTYQGRVASIANQPEPPNFRSGNIKEYATLVRVEGSTAGIKPGMTAEVEILVANLKNVVLLPLSCVVEHQGRFYVWKPNGSSSERVEVQVGLSNDSVVEIRSGVEANENVYENPTPYEKRFLATVVADEQVDPASRFGEAATKERDPRAAGAGRGPGAPGGGAPGGGAPGSGGPGASGGPGGAGAGGAGGARGGLMALDTDGDGKVSKDEAPEQMKAFFDRIDGNGDGFIDKSEADAAAKARAAAEAGGGGGPPGG